MKMVKRSQKEAGCIDSEYHFTSNVLMKARSRGDEIRKRHFTKLKWSRGAKPKLVVLIANIILRAIC